MNELELEFLRFFYGRAGVYFGPADSDCYRDVKEAFLTLGKGLPPGYELPDDDEDE